MREAIVKLINEFLTAKGESFGQHPLGDYVRNDIPQIINSTGIIDTNKYMVTASVGQGTWAQVPWIAILDKAITTTPTKGVYVVYLISEDTNRIYLTLNQGCEKIRKSDVKNRKKYAIEIMRDNAAKIIRRINKL